MRIAQIPPLYEAVPPRFYGGTERVVAALSDSLVELGHEVTVFTSGEAQTKARVHAVRDQALRLDGEPLKSDLAAHLAMLHEVRRCANRFDVLHFHTELLHLPVFEHLAAKCLTTLHGRLDLKELERVFRCWPEFALVSISNQQRHPMVRANWMGTVLHGLPPEQYRPVSKPGRYLAFLGRMSPEKAPDTAIRIALRAEVPLKMAAKVDPADRDYFNHVVKPMLRHPLVEFVGEINEGQKAEFLGGALALLFPICWPEPFGLVMIEAMACGTPVIAFDAGAVPEIVEDGVSGFIVTDEAGACAAVTKLAQLSRRRVRQAFETRFTASRMARDYLDLYAAIRSLERQPLARAI
jgi:glycosyltransferase involved in cell wall biosynthesis